MNNKSKFEALIARARSEQTPSVDVAGRVIDILTAEQTLFEPVSERSLMWLAAFSSAVAVPVVVAAIIVYQAWVYPLYELSQAVSWVIQ
jgi:hypothetical protein